MRTKIILTLVTASVLPLQNALAQPVQGQGYGHHFWGGPWGGWFMGPIMMLFFIAVLVIAVVFIVRRTGGRDALDSAPGKTPLDILKERFAKGEIDKEEFEDRRKTLSDQ